MQKSKMLEDFEVYLLSEKRSSKNTTEAYLHDIGLFLPFLKDRSKTLRSCIQSDIEAFLQSDVCLSVSSRTVARRIAALKTFSVFLRRQKRISIPVSTIVSPRWAKPLPNCLSERDVRAILEHAAKDTSDKGIRNMSIVSSLYALGLRVSELTALRTNQVRLDAGFINVVGKGDKERSIPLADTTKDILMNYLSCARKNLLQRWQTSNSSCAQREVFARDVPYLFFSRSKGKIQPMTRQAVSIMFSEMAKAAGIKQHVSPHILRHSVATHLLGNGADLRTLQTFLGHGTIATVQIYTHVDMSRLRAAYDKKHPRSGNDGN